MRSGDIKLKNRILILSKISSLDVLRLYMHGLNWFQTRGLALSVHHDANICRAGGGEECSDIILGPLRLHKKIDHFLYEP